MMKVTRTFSLGILALFTIERRINSVSAFLHSFSANKNIFQRRTGRTQGHYQGESAAPKLTTRLQVLWDPRNPECGSELVSFPTPSQRAEIKKEASRRKARKQLPFFSFPLEETNGAWSTDTYQAVWNLLVNHEIVQLKGICREERKHVWQTAKQFCEQMEDLISASDDEDDEEEEEEIGSSLPVALLSTSGHSALIYCPTLPVDHPDKLRLRTSVGQKNVWKARPKPLRDNAGKIIKGVSSRKIDDVSEAN
mmetsp:Transcript_31266/g.52124  ORF Transcript_31266/g.52124 Transcript_31266/m.52124 type:complete len:252 (+) Transcript_31266:258-1013(+)